MWWLVLPGAAAVAWKVYERLRDREAGREPGARAPAEAQPLPRLGPRLDRWVAILRGPDDEEEAPEPPAPTVSVRRKVRFGPAHLTAATAVLLVAITLIGARSPGPVWGWAQAVLLGALIGIGTNWVAIRMLFRPRRRVLGFFQGVIPANRERIAAQIARGVAAHLLDRETLRRAVHESDLVGRQIDAFVTGLGRLVRSETFQTDVEELVAAYGRALVRDPAFRRRLVQGIAGLARRMPERMGGVLGAFSDEIGPLLEDLVHRHQDALLDGLDEQVPALVGEVSERVVAWLDALPPRVETRRAALEQAVTEALARRIAAFDVEGLVRARLETFSTADLEALILSATEEQLVWLQVLGWFIGAAAAPLVAAIEALARAV